MSATVDADEDNASGRCMTPGFAAGQPRSSSTAAECCRMLTARQLRLDVDFHRVFCRKQPSRCDHLPVLAKPDGAAADLAATAKRFECLLQLSKPLKSKDCSYSESMSTHTRASRMAVIATEWGVRHSRGGVYIDAELLKWICLKQKSQQAFVTGIESAFRHFGKKTAIERHRV